MTDSLKKDIIEISDYSKYLEQVKIYYNLKNKTRILLIIISK